MVFFNCVFWVSNQDLVFFILIEPKIFFLETEKKIFGGNCKMTIFHFVKMVLKLFAHRKMLLCIGFWPEIPVDVRGRVICGSFEQENKLSPIIYPTNPPRWFFITGLYGFSIKFLIVFYSTQNTYFLNKKKSGWSCELVMFQLPNIVLKGFCAARTAPLLICDFKNRFIPRRELR